MRRVLDVLVKESEKRDKNPLIIKNYLVELFAVINEYIDSKLKNKIIRKKGLGLAGETGIKAKAFIEKNYFKKLLLKDIAAEVNLSPFRFAHVFKEYAGVSPIEYVIRVRLENAKKLLRATKKPVSEVANETGFSDQNYFTRIFKKIEKTTPSGYRAHK